jgi:predicted component of type VI protein secretion system
MRQGPTVGKSFDLAKDVITIGRDLSNDLVINDAEMSRHHARLTRHGTNYVVEDLGSTNGTFVNSARASGQYTLKVGDLISLGDTVSLVFEGVAMETAATVVGGFAEAATGEQPRAPVASYTPPPPPQSISAPEPAYTPAPKSNRGKIIAVVGCLTLLCCAATSGLAVFLWYAPASFWKSIGF